MVVIEIIKPAVEALTTATPPSKYGFNCDVVNALPYKGDEVLFVAAILCVIVVMWGVVYVDVCVKQWFPSFVDATVLARVDEIQKQFPNLGLSEEEKEFLYKDAGGGGSDDAVAVKSHYAISDEDGVTPIEYDSVCAQEAYISQKTIDLDLLTVFANNSAYSTMSEYSACTTRGYNMLSTTLAGSAFSCAMFCVHNLVVDPKAGKEIKFKIFDIPLEVPFGVVALYLYLGILCTAIVMTSAGSPVHRSSNIMLFTNFPYNVNGKYNPIRHLHVLGVVIFGLAIFCHLFQMLAWGKEGMPNYDSASYIMIVTLVFALTFAVSGLWGKLPGTNKNQGRKISIVGEAGMMFGCILSYVHWETYATAYCTGKHQEWEKVIVAAFLAPFLLAARHQLWAPTQFATAPSLMLMRHGQPVAFVGPCPVLSYYGATAPGLSSSSAKPIPRARAVFEDK